MTFLHFGNNCNLGQLSPSWHERQVQASPRRCGLSVRHGSWPLRCSAALRPASSFSVASPRWSPKDRTLHVLPLHHIHGVASQVSIVDWSWSLSPTWVLIQGSEHSEHGTVQWSGRRVHSVRCSILLEVSSSSCQSAGQALQL